MKIQIAERLKPFSHTPGASCLIPGTCFEIEAYPTRLRIGKKIELKFKLSGLVEEFTLQQDLEKNCVFIFGKAKEGFYRLRIEGSDSGFDLYAEKVPYKGLHYDGSAHGTLKAKEKLHVSAEVPFSISSSEERLSLGNHKDQDWDKVQRRADLKEMLPVLFSLGQKIPRIPPQPLTGTARLLEMPKDRKEVAHALQALLKAAFTKIFIPRLVDDQHHGLVPEEPVQGNRFFLIQEGAKTVRGLFFEQNERRLKFLPFLPIPLDCGRMIGIKAKGIGEIDFEWSKKSLRRVIIRPSLSGDVILELQNELKSFRVRHSLKEKGRRQKKTEPLLLQAGKVCYLDLFQG
jgi:glycosyl hydrolase family 95